MRLSVNRKVSTRAFITALVLLLLLGSAAFVVLKDNNAAPLPKDLKDKVDFRVVYPAASNAQIQQTSYVYHAQQRVLNFKVYYADTTVVFSQQPAPRNIGSDTQSYYPALGIHPYAQFGTDLGQVALTKFYQSGSLKPFSQTAVMVSKDTLLAASSEKTLTNEQWKKLFDELKITK
jgi:hypothetical protein